MKKILFVMDQSHIDQSVSFIDSNPEFYNYTKNCPVANLLKEAFSAEAVQVNTEYSIVKINEELSYFIELKNNCIKLFLLKFDCFATKKFPEFRSWKGWFFKLFFGTKLPKPISFYLEIPEELANSSKLYHCFKKTEYQNGNN